jgi:DNA uptake protein ComE-like DNA-binding protein
MKTNRLRHFLLTWFTFTRAEKHAAILLTGTLLLSQSLLFYRSYYYDSPAPVQVSTDVKFPEAQITRLKPEEKKKWDQLHLDVFNPDTASLVTLVKLGMTEKQAGSMIRFRTRSGGFYSVSDLKKVHVLSPSLLERWIPYLRFSERKNQNTAFNRSGHALKQTVSRVDINQADTLLLQTLPLIGSGRAKAIVSYRARLGGYVHIHQLLEIRAIPDSVFRAIEKRIYCDQAPLRQLAINQLPADSIRHPYLPKPLGKLIVSYREQHGPFTRLKDLENLPLVNAEILTKIAPYLNLNP